MASIERTAYPRISKRLTAQELAADYRLSKEESDLVSQSSRGDAGRLSLAALLKARQLLNYFPVLSDLPDQARDYLIEQTGVDPQTTFLDEELHSTTLHRYRATLRMALDSRSFSDGGREQVEASMRDAAHTMSASADLINTAIEVLVASRIELPAFSTLNRIAGNIRQAVHEDIYAQATALLDDTARSALDAMLVVPSDRRLSQFAQLKQFPGPPTLTHVREWTQRLVDIDKIHDPKWALKNIPHTKVRQFAAEAAALDLGDLRDVCTPGKRYTLLLCFLHQAQSDTRDQLVEMFIRRMRRTQRLATEQLQALRAGKRETEESLIDVLAQVLHHATSAKDDADLGSEIRTVVDAEGGIEALSVKLRAVTNYHDNNYLPLLWPVHAVNRIALLRLLDQLDIASSTQDSRLLIAFDLVRKLPLSRQKHILGIVDIGFASQRWQDFVCVKDGNATVLDHRSLEVCVLMHMANAFQSGDLYVRDAGAFADYREQLLPRMRTWNDAAFYRPSRKETYQHIDALFTDAINWELIEIHWQDMMQVVLSIQAGKVLPSMLLRKLSSHNRQNKLYLAFRELGRVERTLFLLRYVSENQLRQSIRAETTKVESYNDFLDWIVFGGPIIKSGDPEEQLKQVKYMDLVANAVMLHNVVDMTAALTDMIAEGQVVTALQVARLSPYWREHIRRFGQYVLNMDEELPPSVFRSLKLRPENSL